jgi:hypothetical protein
MCRRLIKGARHPVVITMDGVNGGNAGAIASQNGVHRKIT